MTSWLDAASGIGVQVTVGGEGFFGPGDPNSQANPQSEQGAIWPQQTGQSFSVDHGPPGIDFTAIHLWPDGETANTPCMLTRTHQTSAA